MTGDDALLVEIKERAAAVFMALPGVTGVGIGGRLRAGRPAGEVVIKVFVERKRPAAEVPPGQLLPLQFEGVGVDVSELAAARLEAAPPATAAPPGVPLVPVDQTDDTKYRPLVGGSRVQVDLTGAGYGNARLLPAAHHRSEPGVRVDQLPRCQRPLGRWVDRPPTADEGQHPAGSADQ